MKLQGQVGAMPGTLMVLLHVYLAKKSQDPLRIREIDCTFRCGHGKVTLQKHVKMGNTAWSSLKHDFLKEETFREQGSDNIFLGQARKKQQ